MLRNYLVISLRNLLKRKIYSIINILGLSVGLAAVIMIFLYVKEEISYDTFHDDADRIYRIAWMSQSPQTRTPHPMAQAMVSDFPEVESAVSLSPLWGPGLTKRTFSVKNPDVEVWFDERNILSVDSTFFNVFSFELAEGNINTVMRGVGGMLISETMANKYFGSERAVGKQLAFDNENQLLIVEGVFKDVPDNSHFHFDFLISYVTLKAFGEGGEEYYTWNDFGHFNYIKLSPGSDVEQLQNKIIPWAARYLDWDEQTLQRLNTSGSHFGLQPITSIHLESSIRWELESNGNIGYVYIMSAAALFILLIACFNFMNLSSAKSMERANEVAVRKSLGAERNQLVSQFLGESILLTTISIVLAGLIVEVLLPSFNVIMGKELVFNILDPITLGLFLVGAIVIGSLAGMYPAVILSALKPILILKGNYSASSQGQWVRTTLVILQFAISMFLIAGSLTIISQLKYLQGKDLGFDKSALITIPVTTNEIREKYDVIQTELLKISGVSEVGAASNIPGKQFNNNPAHLKSNPENRIDVSQCFVDYDFIQVLGIELIEGRSFNRNQPADVRHAFIINERAVVAFGLDNPVGQVVNLEEDGRLVEGEIIGVLKDFNYVSLHSAINPLIIQLIPAYNHIVAKVHLNDFEKTIGLISAVLTQFDEKVTFEYDFLDESLKSQYMNESKMSSIFTSFAVLAIIIACLGLGGLATINFSFRKKEISIRKVLGASTNGLTINLLKEYTFIVMVAVLFSLPFYIVIMQNWLNNFNYHVTINPLIFTLSAIGLLVISCSILSVLTLRVVRENPVLALKQD